MADANEMVDPLIDAVARTLRASEPVGEAAVAGAMTALRREARRRRRVPLLVGLAATLALAAGLWYAGHPPVDTRRVQFALAAPAARRVALVGDFNDWNPGASPLRREHGEWSITLRLGPGRYRYGFMVDGARWQADPATPSADDEFGAPTSVITVSN